MGSGSATTTHTSEITCVAELIGHALAKLGAGHCFGVVGSGNFAVTNALIAAGVPFTAARHEGGAATMADGYARMSGRVGLISVHQGCGLTNAATGIGEAAKSRTPVIVLAAEATASAVGSNFSMDQPALARSVTAESHRVHSAASSLTDVVRAFRAARDERRTVVLNLPLDVQEQSVPDGVLAQLATLSVLASPARPRAADSDILALANALERAERPVIIAGRGGREAGTELRDLAQASGALLATSAVANGLFEGDPFSLGISGGFSSPLTAELIGNADLILGVGCALNMWTMRHGRLIGQHTVVAQLDVETSALGANRPVDLGVTGDAAATARAVTSELKARTTRSAAEATVGYRTARIAERIREAACWSDVAFSNEVETEPDDPAAIQPEDFSGPDAAGEMRIDPRILSRELDRLLPSERIVSIDSGNFMGYPSAYLRVPDEYGFCFTQAFQAIGLGLGTAIGAALARPDRLPVLGTGDGGFLMAVAELETAVRLNIPLVVIVYNDDAYGAEVHHFGPTKPNLDTVTFPAVDIAAIAHGFGASSLTVRELADLRPVTEWIDSSPTRPLVIDARIASDGGAWWLAEAFRGH